MKTAIKKYIAAFALSVCAALCFTNFTAFATEETTTTTSDPDADVPVVSVESSEQETLGSVNFSQANTTAIAVGKSTVLYLNITDMGYSYGTTFESSDETIATVDQIDNRAVKVVGIKSGVVTITATVDSTKGVKVATYELTVGDVSSASSDETASESSEAGIVTEDDDDIDIDLFSSTDNEQLIAYAEASNESKASTILLGLIGWALIIAGVVYVFSVIIRSRTPRMNASPGHHRRYSASSSSRSGRRLLSDKYYRNLKKY